MPDITAKQKNTLRTVASAVLTAVALLLAFFSMDPLFGNSALRNAGYGCFLLLLSLALLRLPQEDALRCLPLCMLLTQTLLLHFPALAHYGGVIIVAGHALLFLYVLLAQRKKRRNLPPRLLFVMTLLGAIVMTLYQAAGYFETGAHGAGIRALLHSYHVLGFHPNWRTVLFSTIMMVVLITYPRKFKRVSKWIPAAFVGLVLVWGLNLLLNPDAARSNVGEFPAGYVLFFHRVPVSALSMLLIYIAWEAVFRPKAFEDRP